MAIDVERSFRLVDPITEPIRSSGFQYMPRLRDLRGKRVGIIDDSKRNARELLEAIYEELDSQYGFASLDYHRKPSASRPVDPAVLEDMRQKCDLVIVGIGD